MATRERGSFYAYAKYGNIVFSVLWIFKRLTHFSDGVYINNKKGLSITSI